ncbi:hypothetical protein [Ruegeria sp.]|uniref:hypothetical protein n=1 Tax=Ruegeria sp. TaxID=1879320 RepID=UPI003AFFDA72
MRQPPAIDTLQACRALEEAGLDPGVAEELVRLIDAGIGGGAASAAELAEVKAAVAKHEAYVVRIEYRVAGYLAVIMAIFLGMITLAQNFSWFVGIMGG